MKILFATDGSRPSREAMEFLRLLPLPQGSALKVIGVVDLPRGVVGPEVSARTAELIANQQWTRAERMVENAREVLTRDGVAVTTQVRGGDTASEILLAADEINADLVVVGSRGLTGLGGLLLGSVARAVVKRSSCPVLVGRAPRSGLQQVLVATDGSDHAHRAVQFAARLPLPGSTKFTLVHGVRLYAPFPELLFPAASEEFEAALEEVRQQQRQAGAAVLAAAQDELAGLGRTAEMELRVGDPAAEILAVAEERQADLIIAGARGASLIEGLLTGSVADHLVKEAPCSVLIVRHPG